MNSAELDAYIQKLVDEAPPVSEAQLERLRRHFALADTDEFRDSRVRSSATKKAA